MRRSLLFLLVTFTLFSCNKENSALTPEDQSFNFEINTHEVNMEKVKAFNLLTLHEKRMAYPSLSKYDKFYFWINKLENFISSYNLSEQQTDAIHQILNRANSPDIFLLNSKESLDFKKFVVQWTEKHSYLFPDEESKGFATIFDKESNIQTAREVIKKDCDCATDFVFIDDCRSKKSCLVPPTIGCEPNYDGGCGFWWLSECDKLCI